jgi:glutaredoxin
LGLLLSEHRRNCFKVLSTGLSETQQSQVSIFNFRHNLISTIGCNLSTSTMPPVVNVDDPIAAVAQHIKDNNVMVFSKTTCPFCLKLKSSFKQNRIDFTAVELDTMGPMGSDMQKALLDLSGQKTVPNVFINGKHIGK